jgi:phenylpropionate dioxygenase-like ring-hydroxylating dioxygenase large terminal subunit
MQKYLRNIWYLAAWAEELSAERMLARTLLDEPLILFRDAAGQSRALRDRCPHRFAPLSRGKLENGTVRCGYHGLGFGPDGACIHNPHGPVPKAARVAGYPLLERHAAVWVWMGDISRIDESTIPDLSFIERTPAPARAQGLLQTRANYELMVDNIMDLSHADYLHPDSLGGGINTRTKGKVERGDREIAIKWHATNETLPPLMNAMLPTPGDPADFVNEVYWSAPGVMRQRVLFGPAGQLETRGADSWTAHVMTPETATSTHYFFCHTSDALRRDPSAAPMIKSALLKAFQEEDAPMIEAQQARIGEADFWSLSPSLFSVDSGALQVRRTLDRMIREENALTQEGVAT